MMISGPVKVAFVLLSVTVFGAEIPKHTEEEGESLPEIAGEWAQADQQEMPMKGQKKPKQSAVLEKKKDILIQKHEDDDADEEDVKKGAPAPAPLLQDHHVKEEIPKASEEDDADHPHDHHKTPEHLRAPVTFADLLGKEFFGADLKDDKDISKMTEEEFSAYAVEATKPLMDSLYKLVDDHQQAMKKAADEDPKQKWYLELFEPQQFKQFYPEEAAEKEKQRELNRIEMAKWEEEEKQKKEEEKKKEQEAQPVESPPVDMDLLKKEIDEFSSSTHEVKNFFQKLQEEFAAAPKHPAKEDLKKDLHKIAGVLENDEAIKKAIAHLTTNGDAACAEARRETGNNKYSAKIWDDEDIPLLKKHAKEEQPPKESEDDIEAAHKELINRESSTIAAKKEHTSTVRSNAAVQVDANGNVVQMNQMARKDPKELAETQKSGHVRQADDTNSKDRNKVEEAPDADDKMSQSTTKPHSVFGDNDYQSPEDKERAEDDAKRSNYLGIAGFVVVAILIGWLLIRHRAQQMIDRSTAFDDASSVSSSTVTEENPTVKVNRALLERMANISQKLSEKVEEVRASSNADSNSSGGSARQYTRKKQKDPLLGASA